MTMPSKGKNNIYIIKAVLDHLDLKNKLTIKMEQGNKNYF